MEIRLEGREMNEKFEISRDIRAREGLMAWGNP